MEMKLELVAIPVTDVDRARDFYKDKVGFTLDHDHTVNEKLRFVQMTPVGSACSICFGIGIADNMKPGSIKGLQMVVKDAQAAHDELKNRGVEVTDVDNQVWGKFVYFNDPDGNAWALQELPPRGQFKVKWSSKSLEYSSNNSTSTGLIRQRNLILYLITQRLWPLGFHSQF